MQKLLEKYMSAFLTSRYRIKIKETNIRYSIIFNKPKFTADKITLTETWKYCSSNIYGV